MFTGLIEAVGEVAGIRRGGTGAVLAVSCPKWPEGMEIGASIAVSGACLTVAKNLGGGFEADVSPETLRATNLGELGRGDRVNIERALRADGRLGGHFVLGHVDGRCEVRSVKPSGGFTEIGFSAPAAVSRYLVPKGSVAIDGVSLTINGAGGGVFSVMVIPHTMERTNLGRLRAGLSVNVETDILGKYVIALTGAGGAGLTMGDLAKAGFIEGGD